MKMSDPPARLPGTPGHEAASSPGTPTRSAGGRWAWRAARRLWRAAPLGPQARFRIRGRLLRWMGSSSAAPSDEEMVRQLRLALQTFPLRRVVRGLARAVREGPESSRRRLSELLRHRVNEDLRRRAMGGPGPTAQIIAPPWPDDRPLVSVVIVCFDYGRYVRQALASVQAQTWRDLEVIVVDGGSSDPATLETLRELERGGTRVLFREGRHFVGSNRNFGIEHGRGRYVCCLDADDLLAPTYLEKAVFLLERWGYDLVSTSLRRFGEEEDVVALPRYPTLADLLRDNEVATCAVFRRELWERAGGYRDQGLGGSYVYEDWQLWIRMAALGARVANLVDEPLFRYRVHSRQSLSQQEGTVPAMKEQRRLVGEANRDVLSESALRRSAERAAMRLRGAEAFPLLSRAQVDERPVVMLTVPALILGGADRLLAEVVSHLAAHGWRAIVLSSSFLGAEHGDSTGWFERATHEIYHLPRFLDGVYWRDFLEYLLRTRRVSVLWNAGSPWIYELLPELRHDHPELRLVDQLFNLGHLEANRRAAPDLDLTLVESRELEDAVRRAGEERVVRIPSGVDLSAFRPDAEAPLRRRLGIAEGELVVGFSGRLAEEKDPLAFVELAARFPPGGGVAFVMTGLGPLEGEVRGRMARRGVRSLHFLGALEDVREALALYDVLAVPSRRDGRPLVALEALASGVPLLASRVGGLPELIDDGVEGFLLPPGDVDAFARAVARLRDEPDLLARMRQQARARAERSFGLAAMLRRYRDVLDPLAGRSAAGEPAGSGVRS